LHTIRRKPTPSGVGSFTSSGKGGPQFLTVGWSVNQRGALTTPPSTVSARPVAVQLHARSRSYGEPDRPAKDRRDVALSAFLRSDLAK
jgi:hypothetical protein